MLEVLNFLKMWATLLQYITQMTNFVLTDEMYPLQRETLKLFWDRLVSIFWTSSPTNALFIWGLRVWLGASTLRKTSALLYALVKIILKKTTMVVALGSGNPRSIVRRDTWRVTVPIRDFSLTSFKIWEFVLYVTELVGLTAMSLGLLHALVAPESSNLMTWFVSSLLESVIRLRLIRMLFDYPFEILVILPAMYAFMRYRTVSSLAKSKVTVIQTTNNYLGGSRERKMVNVDIAIICAATLEATGLPWLSMHFLNWRTAVHDHGLQIATTSYLHHIWNSRDQTTWARWLDLSVLLLTYPLSVAATLTAGTRRPVLVPAIQNTFAAGPAAPPQDSSPFDLSDIPRGVGGSPPESASKKSVDVEGPSALFVPVPEAPRRHKNAMVEIFKFPHDVPLEIFTAGSARLLGGPDLREIGVVSTPKLLVRIPMKPVVNNTFGLQLLDLLGPSPFREKIKTLTKVPPNPYRNAVEIQKFITRDIQWDPDQLSRHSSMTERQFIIAALNMVLGFGSNERIKIPDLTRLSKKEDYLNSSTKKSHPGWTTRAFGGQTRDEAWTYSLERAIHLWSQLRAGVCPELFKHVWIFLGVVKKQATRKPDEELRDRGAVIPEQEVQLCWRTLGRPFQKACEAKLHTWSPKFELFHAGLQKHWIKFERLKDRDFSNEDMIDHGASIEKQVASIIVDWVESHAIAEDGSPLGPVARLLWQEMITAVLALPDPSGVIHLFKTSRGMKDGVDGTSFWGAIAKMIGEFHKIWRAWSVEPKLRETFVDIFDVVRSISSDIHGDNALTAYPKSLSFLAGTNPEAVKWLKEVGMYVKPEESALTNNLADATLMSWHMSNIGSATKPQIVGWKATPDLMKGFFLPERMLDYGKLNPASKDYLGEILVSLYILGYWNFESRKLIEAIWSILWQGADEHPLKIVHIRDFVYKTGLDPESLEQVLTSSPHPYPPVKVANLWLGAGSERYVDRYAQEGPTPAQALNFVGPLLALGEGLEIRPSVQFFDWAVDDAGDEL